MNKAEYKELMAKIADGGKVSQETFDAMTAFAKKAKTKRPPADSVLDAAAVKEAATTVKGTKAEKKAPKEKAPKAECSEKGCSKPSRASGMCPAHYSRLVYRQDPEKAERVREASRKYAAKKREEKAAAKALEAQPAA
jgi:hypothetical protein